MIHEMKIVRKSGKLFQISLNKFLTTFSQTSLRIEIENRLKWDENLFTILPRRREGKASLECLKQRNVEDERFVFALAESSIFL